MWGACRVFYARLKKLDIVPLGKYSNRFVFLSWSKRISLVTNTILWLDFIIDICPDAYMIFLNISNIIRRDYVKI